MIWFLIIPTVVAGVAGCPKIIASHCTASASKPLSYCVEDNRAPTEADALNDPT